MSQAVKKGPFAALTIESSKNFILTYFQKLMWFYLPATITNPRNSLRFSFFSFPFIDKRFVFFDIKVENLCRVAKNAEFAEKNYIKTKTSE